MLGMMSGTTVGVGKAVTGGGTGVDDRSCRDSGVGSRAAQAAQ